MLIARSTCRGPRRSEMGWPGNKQQLIERLGDMHHTICTQEQLFIFYDFHDIAIFGIITWAFSLIQNLKSGDKRRHTSYLEKKRQLRNQPGKGYTYSLFFFNIVNCGNFLFFYFLFLWQFFMLTNFYFISKCGLN